MSIKQYVIREGMSRSPNQLRLVVVDSKLTTDYLAGLELYLYSIYALNFTKSSTQQPTQWLSVDFRRGTSEDHIFWFSCHPPASFGANLLGCAAHKNKNIFQEILEELDIDILI